MSTPSSSNVGPDRPRSSMLAWALWLLSVAVVAASVAIVVWSAGFETLSSEDGLIAALAALVFPTVGMLIASRRPENTIGWLYLGIGLAWSATGLASVLNDHAPAGSATAEWGAWLSAWLWAPALLGTLTLPLLLYPDGRLVSRRWRPVLWMVVYLIAFDSVGAALGASDAIHDDGVGGALTAVLSIVSLPLYLVAAFGPLASLITRFRRSHGIERQQVKLFALVAAVLIAMPFAIIALSGLLGASDDTTGGLLFTIVPLFGIIGLPVATGVAILRYRLYDIDRIINRTIVYAVMTAGIVATYLAAVVLLQRLLDPFTRGSDLAVAGATLAAAALIRPAHGRIQRTVDRRFYRHKYDAARTIASFSTRLRDEIDLDTLTNELRAVITQTMQPAHVSLWVREASRGAAVEPIAPATTVR